MTGINIYSGKIQFKWRQWKKLDVMTDFSSDGCSIVLGPGFCFDYLENWSEYALTCFWISSKAFNAILSALVLIPINKFQQLYHSKEIPKNTTGLQQFILLAVVYFQGINLQWKNEKGPTFWDCFVFFLTACQSVSIILRKSPRKCIQIAMDSLPVHLIV